MRIAISTGATAVTLLFFAGCRAEPESVSPFSIHGRPDLTAGIPFSAMEGARNPQAFDRFSCEPIWADGRECRINVEFGTLIATVDDRGRVVRLKIETVPRMRGPSYDMRTSAMINRASREYALTREAWDTVTPAQDSARTQGTAAFHWIDAQNRWTAAMWYQPLFTYLPEGWKGDMPQYRDTLAYLPDSVVTTDVLGFHEFVAKRPPEPTTGPPDGPADRLRFDLEMVASAQAEHFEKHRTYATTPDALIFAAGEGIRIEITEATNVGWAAVATHDNLPGAACVIYGGRVTSPPATPGGARSGAVGEVACDDGDSQPST